MFKSVLALSSMCHCGIAASYNNIEHILLSPEYDQVSLILQYVGVGESGSKEIRWLGHLIKEYLLK